MELEIGWWQSQWKILIILNPLNIKKKSDIIISTSIYELREIQGIGRGMGLWSEHGLLIFWVPSPIQSDN